MISVAAAIRRVLAFLYPPHTAVPQLAALDEVFASHAALTLAQILPALAFVLVCPFAVLRMMMNRYQPGQPLPLLFLHGPQGARLQPIAMSVYSVSAGRSEEAFTV